MWSGHIHIRTATAMWTCGPGCDRSTALSCACLEMLPVVIRCEQGLRNKVECGRILVSVAAPPLSIYVWPCAPLLLNGSLVQRRWTWVWVCPVRIWWNWHKQSTPGCCCSCCVSVFCCRTWFPGGDGGAWWGGTCASTVVCQHSDMVSSAGSKSRHPGCRLEPCRPHSVCRCLALVLPPVPNLSKAQEAKHTFTIVSWYKWASNISFFL